MKASLLDSITKIINYIKAFMIKTEKNIKFEGNKSGVIKVMLNPLLEEKSKEESLLLSQLKILKQERSKVIKEIQIVREENEHYNKIIESLKALQNL